MDHVNVTIDSAFDWKPKDAAELQGTATIEMFLMKAKFDIVWSTRLDEANGDYYPTMEIKNFALDFIPDD